MKRYPTLKSFRKKNEARENNRENKSNFYLIKSKEIYCRKKALDGSFSSGSLLES